MLNALSNFCYLSFIFILYMLSCNVVAEDLSVTQPSKSIETTNTELNDESNTGSIGQAENVKRDKTQEIQNEDTFFSFLDAPQRVISTGVEAFARNIDEFFSNDDAFYESSGTYLRLRADSVFNEAGDRGYEGDIKLKLRLPHTKKRLKLTFESDADERQDDVTSQPENTPVAAVEEKDYFAGIQATLGREDEWQFKPSLGLRLSSNIEPYIRFRARRKYEYEKWSINWHETPYWFDSFGWGVDSYLEFNRKITDDDLFRTATFARWTRESDKFELSQTFSMYHTLSKRRAVSYYVGVYGESEPTVYATYYLTGINYRQNIHKNYLFLEILPQIRYAKDNDFHSEHSIIFRLEMVFKK